MDHETMSKLRLDRRLIRRRGWIAEDDLGQELEALPDVSDKIAPAGDGGGALAEPAPEEG